MARAFLGTALAAGLALGAAAPAAAERLDVNLSVGAVRAALAGALPELKQVPVGQYDLGVVLRPESDRDLLQLHAGALVTGEYPWQELNVAVGAGIRAVYVGQDHDSGGALAIGGQLEMPLPLPTIEGVSFAVHGWFAPDATSLGELRRYVEWSPSLAWRWKTDRDLYLGYRSIRYDLGARDDLKADNGLHIGLRMRF